MYFLANENFPMASIRMLRDANYNVASVIEDSPGSKDYDVLRRANVETRVILTFDRDYGELIYKHKLFTPAGVVYFRFDPATPEEPGKILLTILDNSKISIVGEFTVAEKSRIRQRTISKILQSGVFPPKK